MSDDLGKADTEPSPAPSPTPEPAPEPGKIMGVPLAVLVRGGTTSSAWDQEKLRQYAQSEALRAHQDSQFAAVEGAQGKPNIAAGMLSRELLGRGNPKVVIEYCYRDSVLNRECLAEVVVVPKVDSDEQELALVLVCPKCLERTGRMDDSQCIIRQSNRMFWLDTTKPSMWVNPMTGAAHAVAGTITLNDKVQCSALGCTWRFTIEASKLWEV